MKARDLNRLRPSIFYGVPERWVEKGKHEKLPTTQKKIIVGKWFLVVLFFHLIFWHTLLSTTHRFARINSLGGGAKLCGGK